MLVRPHAMRLLRPSTTPGSPGIVAPATVSVGVSIAARYHSAGARSVRCGSLASSGLPDFDRDGPITHEFEARLMATASRISAASAGIAGISDAARRAVGSA